MLVQAFRIPKQTKRGSKDQIRMPQAGYSNIDMHRRKHTQKGETNVCADLWIVAINTEGSRF